MADIHIPFLPRFKAPMLAETSSLITVALSRRGMRP